ncbi:hypothetical protein GF386_02530 [Candidatus Pacearchaeota archaeon]|nr:hypothetical protein [Candidatus Pacearchaeota archaeon]MBD3283020.1 hypothetical protein [Candidatus Pacearchaeota archaeon]
MDEQRIKEITTTAEKEDSNQRILKIVIIIFVAFVLVGTSVFFIFMFIGFSEETPQNQSSTNSTESVVKNTSDNKTETNEEPSTKQNITIKENCTENWNCTNWTNCTNGVQNRACTDLNECGTKESIPNLTRKCCSWVCEEWSECYPDDFQFRNCIKPSKCEGVELGKPPTKQFCNYSESFPCEDTDPENNLTEAGTVTDKNNIKWEDNCFNETTLIEFSCDIDGSAKSEQQTCLYACEDGECINQTG